VLEFSPQKMLTSFGVGSVKNEGGVLAVHGPPHEFRAVRLKFRPHFISLSLLFSGFDNSGSY
jgi:hypothetical protein